MPESQFPLPRKPHGHRRSGDFRRRRAAGIPLALPGLSISTTAKASTIRMSGASAAGLTGADWLQWLNDRDPKGFDWSEYGRVLLEVPYAPPGARMETADLQRLLDAAEAWLEPPVDQEVGATDTTSSSVSGMKRAA